VNWRGDGMRIGNGENAHCPLVLLWQCERMLICDFISEATISFCFV